MSNSIEVGFIITHFYKTKQTTDFSILLSTPLKHSLKSKYSQDKFLPQHHKIPEPYPCLII